VLELSDAEQPDGSEYLSEGAINLPEDSVVDTESDGQGFVNEPQEEESDGDHEKDEDFVMGDVLDSDDSDSQEFFVPSMKGKRKVIKVCSFLHLPIQSLYY
jgi:hypothetical protein